MCSIGRSAASSSSGSGSGCGAGARGRDNPTVYRLFTTLIDPDQAPAAELAAAYAQRCEIENTFDELLPEPPLIWKV